MLTHFSILNVRTKRSRRAVDDLHSDYDSRTFFLDTATQSSTNPSKYPAGPRSGASTLDASNAMTPPIATRVVAQATKLAGLQCSDFIQTETQEAGIMKKL